MINEKDKQERQRRTMHAEREELRQAARRFIRGLFQTGGNVALLPVTLFHGSMTSTSRGLCSCSRGGARERKPQ